MTKQKVHLTLGEKPGDKSSGAPKLYAWLCGIAYYTSPQADAFKADCKKCLKKARAQT